MNEQERHDSLRMLTRDWFAMVRLNLHKDRDCHWELTERWSYGVPPYYEIGHHGYTWRDPETEAGKILERRYRSRAGAELGLMESILQALRDLEPWSQKVLHDEADWDDEQVDQALRITALNEQHAKLFAKVRYWVGVYADEIDD